MSQSETSKPHSGSEWARAAGWKPRMLITAVGATWHEALVAEAEAISAEGLGFFTDPVAHPLEDPLASH